MKLNLNELAKAVAAVAGIANENAQIKQDFVETQQAIDALTAPGWCVGIAAVSAALDHKPVNHAIAAFAEKTK